MPKPPDGNFSHRRRGTLKYAGAAGLSLLLSACRPEPEKPLSGVTGDFAAEGALRLDLRQRLKDGSDDFTLERLRFERRWPGRLQRLADGPEWGDYRLAVYDASRGELLFRQGFDTGVDPGARAATTVLSVRVPFPRRPVYAAVEKRRGQHAYETIATFPIASGVAEIDPSPPPLATRVEVLAESGVPAHKVDIAILGDGYREADYSRFVGDAKRAAGYLFSIEPFAKRRRDFNVYAVFTPSAESGVTDPYRGEKRDTAFRCAYGTGGAQRTLADGNPYAVREAAAAVPYDFLLVLANARRYGGSAHFGGPAVVAAGSAAARYLVLHEFAHSFAGLADEYYLPDAGAAPFHGPEPWHPNVTASPGAGKWRALVRQDAQPAARSPDLPLSRWNKREYERYFADYLRRYERLREQGADEAEVEKFLDAERERQAALLRGNADARGVGYFEGANGHARGIYRSEPDCIMFSLQADYFCAACSAAIERMIDWHCR